jgi:hypothetical protein
LNFFLEKYGKDSIRLENPIKFQIESIFQSDYYNHDC